MTGKEMLDAHYLFFSGRGGVVQASVVGERALLLHDLRIIPRAKP